VTVRAAATAAALLVAGSVAVAASTAGEQGSATAPGVRLLLLGRFDQPTYLTSPPGDRRRRFVVEREGRIRVVRRGRTLRDPFLDIRELVDPSGEGGLLSMAFAPDYARSRRFYVYYTDNAGDLRVEQLRRARSTRDRALPSSRRLVIREEHHRPNHKGGQLQFGPDGMLYLGFGDGGGSGDPDRAAQSLRRLPGKLLRIDPRAGGGYRIPGGNPFGGRPGARGEIFAYGLRNPYRFSFDRRRGHLTVGDVGESAVEEIDFVPNRRRGRRAPPGGQNFGWSLFEGRRRFRAGTAPGHQPPAVQRTHSQGSCSIIGGYVIRDRSLGPGLLGRYLFGDLCDPRLRVARLRSGANRALGLRVPTLVSFGEDARGRLYAISLRGPVYRLARRG
jgi:glucose/arabinose dehydrogenase